MNRETAEAYALATVGACEGVWRYYKPELMWSAIGAAALAYNLSCEQGKTLCETFRKQPKVLQVAEVVVFGGHLLNVAPQIDPIHQAFKKIKGG